MQTTHTFRIWLNETRWKLTDEGKVNNESNSILEKVIGFYEITENTNYMASRGWIERK